MDTFQGALGGPFLLALLAMPFYLALGVTALASKLAVYCTAVGLVVVIYTLLDRFESRAAALVAAATFSFLPPSLFFGSAAMGNLHWTQLIFDYGLVLFGLELVRRPRPRPRAAWATFGVGCGLAIFHSVGSVPYVVIAASGALWFARPGLLALSAFLTSSLLGAAPFLYKLLAHRAFGLGDGSGEQTVRRLIPKTLDLSGFGALVYPEGAAGLLFHRTMEGWPLQPGWVLELLWAGTLCLGLTVLVPLVRWSSTASYESGRDTGQAARVASVPFLFAFVYLAAYAVLPGASLNLPLPEFMNVREEGFRNLPAWWAALMVGSAIGLSRLAVRLGSPLGRCVLGMALLPAMCGVLGELSLIQVEGPEDDRSPTSNRAVCFDAFGVFAASSLGAVPWRATEACALLDDQEAVKECSHGAAWGVGMEEARFFVVGSAASEPGSGTPTWKIGEQSVAACARLPDFLRSDCFFGVGWAVGVYDWGKSDWPETACDSLAEESNRDSCWTGVGFRVGDHLHPDPSAMSQVIDRAPPNRRAQVAEGAGVGLGRSWASEAWAASFCERMDSPQSVACVRGVRRSFAMRGGGG